MIEPTKRRLTLLFTAMILGVITVVFGAVSYYYHFSLRRYLETQLQEEVAENILPYAARGDLAGLAAVVDTELFQVLDADGQVVVESSNPLGVDPPVNRRLLQLGLAGTASNERMRLGGMTVLVAYIPIADNRVGRAVAPLDVLSELERIIGYIAVLGLPIMLACSYVLSRLLVARVMIPIRDVFTYQELYSANLSHELLSPLTALKGGMGVTLRRERSPDEYRRALADGLHQVDRIVDLVNDLQLLTSARFRPADLLREAVRLLDLINDGVAARRGRVAERGVKLEVLAADDVECSADLTLVRRVLENLLDNAVKYTPPGGAITVRLDREHSNAVLRVGNDCQPLSAAARGQLFRPFSRGPGADSGSIPGRGLGLYIARYIARSHEGDLLLLPGAESHFDVSLVLPLLSTSGRPRPARIRKERRAFPPT